MIYRFGRVLGRWGSGMRLETLMATVTIAGLLGGYAAVSPAAQEPDKSTGPVFHSNVDLVRVSAVVRDRKGRFVRDLKKTDFEILDGELSRPISDFHTEDAGISMALL